MLSREAFITEGVIFVGKLFVTDHSTSSTPENSFGEYFSNVKLPYLFLSLAAYVDLIHTNTVQQTSYTYS